MQLPMFICRCQDRGILSHNLWRLCKVLEPTSPSMIVRILFSQTMNLYILIFCQPVFTSRSICVCSTSVSCLVPSPTVPDSASLTYIQDGPVNSRSNHFFPCCFFECHFINSLVIISLTVTIKSNIYQNTSVVQWLRQWICIRKATKAY